MRWKRIIMVLLIGFVFISCTASASPEIKQTKIIENNGNFDVEVEVIGTTGVSVNEIPSSDTINPYDFTNIEGIYVPDEDYKLLKIKANYDSSQVSEKDIGAGGCTNEYDNKIAPYPYADVYLVPSEPKMTLYLNTKYKDDASIIGICVYPIPEHTNGYELYISDLLTYDWLPKISGNNNYFAFGRRQGDKDNIPVDGAKNIEIGNFVRQADTDYSRILLHVHDSHECGGNATCWRRPAITIIPEFSTVAIPIAAVLGLVFFFQHRKKKEE